MASGSDIYASGSATVALIDFASASNDSATLSGTMLYIYDGTTEMGFIELARPTAGLYVTSGSDGVSGTLFTVHSAADDAPLVHAAAAFTKPPAPAGPGRGRMLAGKLRMS